MFHAHGVVVMNDVVGLTDVVVSTAVVVVVGSVVVCSVVVVAATVVVSSDVVVITVLQIHVSSVSKNDQHVAYISVLINLRKTTSYHY